MALFFDQSWFSHRLESLGLSKADLARAAGITRAELDDLWKDQREVSSAEVASMAALLGIEPREVAEKCGVSTPAPPDDQSMLASISALTKRVDMLENMLSTLLAAQSP